MAEEEQTSIPPYVLTVTSTGKTQARSRDFTGHALAQYPLVDDQPRESYHGDFQDGVRYGQGVYNYASGARYNGGWKENRKAGLGRAKYFTKLEEDATEISEFHGDFHDGHKHGAGSFRYANGDIYSGQWASGKKHGNGTYFFASDGSKIVGVWTAGQIESGFWQLKNGAVWTGNFAHGQPCGLGVWKFPNGEELQGEFVQTTESEEIEVDGTANTRITLKHVQYFSQ